MHLLVDSTGIKVEGEGEWNARKHGGAKPRVWRKIHIGIDEKTLGSGPIDHQSRNMTVAARMTAERKTLGHLS